MKRYFGSAFLLLIITIAFFLFLRECERRTDRTLAKIQRSFGEVLHLQPEVRINQTVVFTQTAPIAELAIVTKEQLVDYGYHEKREWLGHDLPLTEKLIQAEGKYRLKAGFDLRQPFLVEIDKHSNEIRIQMPHAKILSVELIGSPSLKDESGFFNPVNEEERQQVLDGLTTCARNAAEASGLKEEADKEVQERLEQILQNQNQKIEINWKKPD